MKRLAMVAFVPIFAMAAPSAHASDWWFIGSMLESPNRIAYFADADEPGKGSGYKGLWIEMVFESDGPLGEARTRSLLVFDCAGRRFIETQRSVFTRSGSTVESPIRWQYWSPVRPDTIGVKLMALSCQRELPSRGHVGSESWDSYARNWVFAKVL